MQKELYELFAYQSASALDHHSSSNGLLNAVTDFHLVNTVCPSAINNKLPDEFSDTEIPAGPTPDNEYFSRLVESVLPSSINMASPWCLGHMAGVLPNFVPPLSQFLVSLQQNLVKRDASRALSLLERQAMAMMHRMVFGLSPAFYDYHVQREGSTLGIMTGGGTLANLTAVWLARNMSFPSTESSAGVSVEGVGSVLSRKGLRGAVVLGSELMHYSIEKAVCLAGIGTRNLLLIPVDSNHRVDCSELNRVVKKCRASGRKVLMIVGVAGSTDSGSVDPLREMAAIAKDAGAHFHVDAAWGGPLLFSRRHRHLLDGIALADTVTIDGHKQLYLPIGTSMLLIRDPHAAIAIEKRSRYILREGSGDLGTHSVEGSREGASLFLHAALNIIGANGFEQLMDANLERAREMAGHIRGRDDLQLLLDPPTNIVLYRHLPPGCRRLDRACTFQGEMLARINGYNTRIQQAQESAGRTLVSRTEFHQWPGSGGQPVVALRAVLSNPRLAAGDIRFVLEDQSRIAAELEDRTNYSLA